MQSGASLSLPMPVFRSIFSPVVLLLTLVLVLSPAAPARADDPQIHGLQVRLDGRRVMVDFVLTDAFDDDLVERVSSGLPTSIVYELELLRDRKRWFDRPLESSTVQVVAMFDALAREYLVNYKLDGKLVESRMARDLDELRAAMTEFDEIPAFTLEPLSRRSRLLVKVRALLGSKTLFSFIPTRVNTEWRESRKFRPPDDLLPPP